MSWSQNPNEAENSPPVFYHSQAVTEEKARAELLGAFKEIVGRREADGAPEDAHVLFQLNSVNSYLDVSWVDSEYQLLGQWTYTLWFLPLGEVCLEHEDGTDHFVLLIRHALFDAVYDLYWDRYGDEFETMECWPRCYFWVPEYRDTPEYIIM